METNLSSSKVVVHNAFYNLLGYGASVLYMLFLLPVVVHYLGIELFGLWSLIIALTGYFALADLGLNTSFAKYVAEYVSLRDYANVTKVIHQGFLYYISVSLIILCLGILVFPFLFSLLHIPQEKYDLARNVFMLSLVAFGVASIASVFVGVLNGIQRSDVLSLLTAATLVVKFAAITAALAGGKGLTGLVVADLIVAAVSVVPLVVMTKKCLPEVSLRWTRYDHTLMKRLLRFGTQLQVSRFAELVQSQFDKLLLARFVGLSSVSMYDFGSRPLGRLRAFPLTALSALVPAVSELDAEHNTERIHAGLVRGTRYVIVLSVPLFLFLVFFANEVITVWLGEGFGQAASTLRLLSLAYFVSVMAGVPAFVAQGIGEPGYQMHATLLQSGLNIVLSTALVISLGYFGAVIGTAIAGIVGGTVFLHRFGKRFTPALLVTIFSVTLKPLVSIAPAIIVGMFVNHLMVDIFSVDTRVGILATLVVVGSLFLAVYIAMLVLTNVFDADDKGFIMNVVPEKFRRLLQ